MRFAKPRQVAVGALSCALACALSCGLNGCSFQSTPSSSVPTSCPVGTATVGASSSLLTTSPNNKIPVYVADPSTTGVYGYQNEPLVSVTICSPGHTLASQCQTVSNILLDTGSFGLRVFRSAITSGGVALVQQTARFGGVGASYALAECQLFGSGADWGPVQKGDVILGNQTASNVSLQVIDHSYPGESACEPYLPDTDPCTAGYNGILGVGMFGPDCGPDCASANPAINVLTEYFLCNGASCGNVALGQPVVVPLGIQVTNPVALMGASNNNGVSLTFPAVGPSGASGGAPGSMTIGIGPGASNTPLAAVVAYPADPNGATDCLGSDFNTVLNGVAFGDHSATTTCANVASATHSFIDSGSNNYYFPRFGVQLRGCATSSASFCPTSPVAVSASLNGYAGAPGALAVGFSIASADALVATGNTAFNNLGADAGPGLFVWGMPFFYGRTIYVGISGSSATFNAGAASGPFWAL